MTSRLLACALLVAGFAPAALAQSPPSQSQPSSPPAAQNQPSNPAQNMQAAQQLPQELRQRLTSAGFTDIKLAPSSFIVSARNKDGRPVLMRITPNSMTVLTEVPATGSSTTGSGSGSTTGSGSGSLPGSGSGSSPSSGGGNSMGSGSGNPSGSGQPMQRQ